MFYVKLQIPVIPEAIMEINEDNFHTRCLHCLSECKPVRQDSDSRAFGYFAATSCPNCADEARETQHAKHKNTPMYYLRPPFISDPESVLDITNSTIYTKCLNCSTEYEAIRLEANGMLLGFINQTSYPNCNSLHGNVLQGWQIKCINDMTNKEHQAFRQSILKTVYLIIKNVLETDIFDALVSLNPQYFYDLLDTQIKILECFTAHEFEELFKDGILENESLYIDTARLTSILSSNEPLGENVLLLMHFSANPMLQAFFDRLIWIAEYATKKDGESNAYSNFAKRESFTCNYKPKQAFIK